MLSITRVSVVVVVHGIKMTSSSGHQFILLLWKNWLLQTRRILLTAFQIVLPALFAVVLLLIRLRVKSDFIADPTYWTSFQASPVLPPNLTIPAGLSPDVRWRLAYSPNVPVVERLLNRTVDLLNGNNDTNPPVIVGMGKTSRSGRC